jgi:hypothetical protein
LGRGRENDKTERMKEERTKEGRKTEIIGQNTSVKNRKRNRNNEG